MEHSEQYENSLGEEHSSTLRSYDRPTDVGSGTDEPTSQEISARAYQFWEERGYIPGFHESDWTRAEQELRELRAQSLQDQKTAPATVS